MKTRLEEIDQVDSKAPRFEQVDKRFEETRADMNARFDQAHSHTNHWMTFMSIVLLALTAAVSLGYLLRGVRVRDPGAAVVERPSRAPGVARASASSG